MDAREGADPRSVKSLGMSNQGSVYYSPTTASPIINCGCGASTAILEISSPHGDGIIVAGATTQDDTKLEFRGSDGGTTITILGMTWGGFTLNGDFTGGTIGYENT